MGDAWYKYTTNNNIHWSFDNHKLDAVRIPNLNWRACISAVIYKIKANYILFAQLYRVCCPFIGDKHI